VPAVELPGAWRAHPADEDLRRAFHDDDFDDRDWVDVAVPGHWRDEPALAAQDGPVLHRTRFAYPDPGDDRRVWLQLDGVFAQGDVWLDGAYVGDTEGYFFPHGFEITDLARERTEHVLAIEVSCPPVSDPDAKRTITGAFQSGDHFPAGWNPGGIWRPVRVLETGPVTIRHGRVLCRDATDERGVLALRLVLDTVDARQVTLHTRVAGVEHRLEQSLGSGENRVEWTVEVAKPARWWPHALGPQPLHDVTVHVHLDTGELSDQRAWRTGFRTVELRNWICRVNGERLFLKGANLSPARPDLAAATPTELIASLRAARTAGLDLVRLHTHISRPELYAAADELGLLVWQDFPLHHRYARSVRRQAQHQAREAVDLLGHHPSVAIWCAHDEPYTRADHARHRTAIAPGVFPQQVPTWNRSILDRSVKRVFDKQDGTRPVVAHSGVLPHLPQLDGTDAHLWFGWYGGPPTELAHFAATIPRHVRFVSAFGAQAVPDDAAFCDPSEWPALDWARLAAVYGLEVEVMRRVVPPEQHETFASWSAATQANQATIVKCAVETLRRLKYRPTGGFTLYRLADTTPQIGFGLLDAAGRPKRAWWQLVDACRPLIIVADPLPEALEPGAELRLAVHAVSDERVDRTGAIVLATMSSPLGTRTWRWQGDVPADSCARIGTLEWTVPTSPGPVVFDLRLTHDDTVITNRYTSHIT
jgi:beta-mannosidase